MRSGKQQIANDKFQITNKIQVPKIQCGRSKLIEEFEKWNLIFVCHLDLDN